MKSPLFIVLVLIAASVLHGEGKKLDSLTTKDGKTYEDVTVREVTPSGIKIFHKIGTATIQYEQLPEKLQEELGGFDGEKARAHRQELAAKQRRNDEQTKRAIQRLRARQLDAEIKELEEAVKEPTRLFVKQMLDGAALGNASFKIKVKREERTRRPLGGYDVRTTYDWVWTNYSEETLYVEGLPSDLVDGDSWTGWTVGAGSHSYTSALGARATVMKLRVVPPPQKK